MSLLDVRDVTIRFGGVTALANVSFSVEPGEIFAIVGPNGAGKSTLFNLISRFCEPEADMASLGIARTFQNIDLFETSTVLQNLLIGRHTRRRASFASQAVFSPAARREEIAHREAVERVIDFLDLHASREQRIAGLPYGTRKVVEVGRALAMEPRIVLLDEPASGLSAEESRDMQFWISDIRAELGITILMVEHDMGLVSAVSDRVLVLAEGRVIALGTPAEVQTHPEVLHAFLGIDREPEA